MIAADGLPDLETYVDRFRLDDRPAAASAATEQILAALQREPLARLSREQLELLDDLGATIMGLVSAELLRRDGWRRKPGWAPSDATPSTDLVPVDHPYRLVNEEQERWIYVSEPYPQNAQELAGLSALVDDGWHVEVRSGLALHYPGHTLRIGIEREGALADPAERATRGLPRPI